MRSVSVLRFFVLLLSNGFAVMSESMASFSVDDRTVKTIIPKFYAGIKQGCDYCSLSSQNTYCLFQYSQSVACSGVKTSGVTSQKVKTEILDVHNNLRRKVAKGQTGRLPGTASNMRKFVWSDELARGAQLWANQCKFNHDDANTCKHDFVGQNIYWSHESGTTQEPEFEKAIQSWYDEINLFGGSVSSYSFNSATGHFTQIIWADTYEVGCGYVAYTGRRRPQGETLQKIYICNYGPGGNFVGKPIYKQGGACSACPTGFGKCEDSLCAAGPGGVPSAPSGGSNDNNNNVNPQPKPPPSAPVDPWNPQPAPSNTYNPYNPKPPAYNPYNNQPPAYNPYNPPAYNPYNNQPSYSPYGQQQYNPYSPYGNNFYGKFYKS